jgi:hypothetical protein
MVTALKYTKRQNEPAFLYPLNPRIGSAMYTA